MNTWKQLEIKYNATPLKERALLLTAVLAVFMLLGYQYVYSPFHTKTERLLTRLQELSNQITVLEQQKIGLQALHSRDPDAQEKKQIAQLQASIEVLNQRLKQKSVELIAPEQMLTVLKQTLAGRSDIQIVAMQSFEPEQLIQPNVQQVSDVNLYKHRVQLTVAGDYFAVVNYLTQLEALPWHFYWESLQYEVKDYPHNEIRIQIYTLSTDEVWIRV